MKNDLVNNAVSALAEIPTVALGSADRAIGRLAQIDLFNEPAGQVQSDLAGDVFMDMFKSNPKPVAEVPESRAVNRALLDWMSENHGYQKSRANTVGNLPSSMMAASLMWEHLNNDKTLKEALKKQEEASKKQEEAQREQDMADALKQAAKQAEAKGNKVQAQNLRHQAKSAATKAQQAQKQATATAKAAMEMVGQARKNPKKQASMAYGTQKAAQGAKDVSEAMAGWGMGSGSATHFDPSAALEFMRQNKGILMQIAKMAGRMRGISLSSKKEKVKDSVVPNQVGHTRDFTLMFASELAQFSPNAPAVLRAQAMGRYTDTGMLGFMPQGEKNKRGPFVAAVDDSPSMHIKNSLPAIVAKAVALGMAQTAKMDGRPYVLYSFASDKKTVLVVRDTDSWQKHLEWASNQISGGTDFNMAISMAMEHLKELGSQKSDCMFISDGEAGISKQVAEMWAKFKEDTGSRLFYIPVGRGGYIDIELLADRVIEVRELDEQAGTDIAHKLGGIL